MVEVGTAEIAMAELVMTGMEASVSVPSLEISSEVEVELSQRAGYYARQSCLVVDYYRVRRRLAFSVPIKSIPELQTEIPQISNYPWAVWLSWALEERVGSLGWAAQCLGHFEARKAASEDLYALSSWPSYKELESLDLCLGHTARILATSYRHWSWMDEALRSVVAEALQRIVTEMTPLFMERFGAFEHKEAVFSAPEPHRMLHNIPLIGGIGIALAANALTENGLAAGTVEGSGNGHAVNRRLHALAMALLDMRDGGFTEGVAYDGYVLDFIIDWLYSIPSEERTLILDHPQFFRFLEESYMLAAPGAALQVVELSDVEPQQMPFHAMAQLKAYHLRPTVARRWYLDQLKLSDLRVDALMSWQTVGSEPGEGESEVPEAVAPPAGALHAHYAVVLRSGWDSEDLAVAIAASNSPLGHIHCNNGSIAIGTQGHWLLTTPGYQQYVANSERDFTTGVTSQNMPVINGHKQVRKASEVISLSEDTGQVCRMEIDVTDCYSPEMNLDAVKRKVWLQRKETVVVEDSVQGRDLESLFYYWHGHPDAAWLIEDGWAGIHLANTTLWITSPQAVIDGRHLQRLRGSRGHLSLAVPVSPEASTIQWVFVVADRHPDNISGIVERMRDLKKND
jgi:hypothetical protein